MSSKCWGFFFFFDCLSDTNGFCHIVITLNCLTLSLQPFPSNSSFLKEAAFPLSLSGKYPVLKCLQNLVVAPSFLHTCHWKAAAALTSVSSAVFSSSVLSCRDLGKIGGRSKADWCGLLAKLYFPVLFCCHDLSWVWRLIWGLVCPKETNNTWGLNPVPLSCCQCSVMGCCQSPVGECVTLSWFLLVAFTCISQLPHEFRRSPQNLDWLDFFWFKHFCVPYSTW